MNSFKHALVALISFALGLVAESRWLLRRQEVVDAGRRRIAALASAVDQQKRARSDLEAALRNLDAAIATPQAIPAGESANAAKVREWSARLNAVKALFDRDPAQTIPEMQLLTGLDWLRMTLTANLDTEDGRRKLLADLRTAAKNKFADSLTSALRAYQDAHDQLLPPSVADLASYIEPKVDPTVFDRYKMVLSGNVSDYGGGYTAIVEQSPVIDEDNDRRVTIGTSGPRFNSGHGAYSRSAAVDANLALQDARLAFASANGRKPTGTSEALPYIQSPLYHSYYEAQTAFLKDNPGRGIQSYNDLAPYLATPELRDLATKIMVK